MGEGLMNINTNVNYNFYANSVNKNKTATTASTLKVKGDYDYKDNSQKTTFSPHGNVIVESSSNGLRTEEDMFNIINENKSWLLDGETVSFKDLDDESKKDLFELTSIHKDYYNKNKKGMSFGGLFTKLGNHYASKREELMGTYSGDELDEKLSKLEKVFKMYAETKVVGNVNEMGSMVNVAHFNLLEAKTAKWIKEGQEAVQNNKNVNDIKFDDVIPNTKQALSELVKQAKNVIDSVTQFFNENGVVSGNQIESLYNYTKKDDTWSLGKLNMTFGVLNQTKKSNADRYSDEQFNQMMNSEEVNKIFTEDEKSFFGELFNSY